MKLVAKLQSDITGLGGKDIFLKLLNAANTDEEIELPEGRIKVNITEFATNKNLKQQIIQRIEKEGFPGFRSYGPGDGSEYILKSNSWFYEKSLPIINYKVKGYLDWFDSVQLNLVIFYPKVIADVRVLNQEKINEMIELHGEERKKQCCIM
jgi:hypothetical protein